MLQEKQLYAVLTEMVQLDAYEDHGILATNEKPLMTCSDCEVNKNIYLFGTCKCGNIYSEKLPHPSEEGEPPRLQMVVGLREKKPSLKVLLSVGGWGSSRFSEMAQTDSTRMAFAADCKRVIDQFDLDGIDIDWEYPGIGTAGVSFSPEDTDNFSLLMKDIRHAIGKDKLLTIATQAGAKYYNLKAVEPYVDYVNIMTYDMEESPNHHSALYRSEMTEEWSCEDAVAAHVAAGFPVGRLVLGIPFYGHGTNEAPELLDYRHIIALDSLQSCWDSAAQVPYMINSQGHVVVNYENAQSIAFKCQFLHQKGMLGAMYWDYDSDDEKGTLRHAVYQGVMNP